MVATSFLKFSIIYREVSLAKLLDRTYSIFCEAVRVNVECVIQKRKALVEITLDPEF
jgi:hypothetical protein